MMRSSVGLKLWTAATGLFLTLFLVVHLAGNLVLFLPPERARLTYNAYSAFLAGNPLIVVASLVTFGSFVAHAVISAVLTLRNRRARGPVGYACDRPQATSAWYRRSMGWLGVVVLVFLVEHMKTFWFSYKFGDVPLDANGHRDLYGLVVLAFDSLAYAVAYSLAMVALGAHLVHGLVSTTYTLGWRRPRWRGVVRKSALALAVVLSLGFAVIPLWMHLFGGGGSP